MAADGSFGFLETQLIDSPGFQERGDTLDDTNMGMTPNMEERGATMDDMLAPETDVLVLDDPADGGSEMDDEDFVTGIHDANVGEPNEVSSNCLNYLW